MEQSFRLSARQRALWRAQGWRPPFRAQAAVLIEGKLDRGALRRTLTELVDRHGILRTTFRRPAGLKVPLQVVAADGVSSFAEVSLAGLDPDERTARLKDLLDREDRQPFDLAAGPALRALLVALEPEKNVLVTSLPALCADRASLEVLVREIGRGAASDTNGDENETVQYSDYSDWQQEFYEADDEDFELWRKYWSRLDFSSLHSFGLGAGNGSSGIGFDPRRLTAEVDSERLRGLRRLAASLDVSLGQLLLACWHLLLSRAASMPNLMIGQTFDGRPHAELAQVVGPFAQRLPVCGVASAGTVLRDFVVRIGEAERNAREWQDYGLGESSLTPAGEPIDFPVGFEHFEWPAVLTHGGLTWSWWRQHFYGERFKVQLTVCERDDRLELAFHHDRDAFAAVEGRWLARRFLVLLDDVVRRPTSRLGDLEVTIPREHHRSQVELNDTAVSAVPEQGIHRLFERQARLHPEETAVVCEDSTWTYDELDRRANQLARHLRSLGVGPEERVAVVAERSAKTVLALLGTLKAGAAFVPLEPAFPPARRALLLRESGAKVLLTPDGTGAESCPAGVEVVSLERDAAILDGESDEDPRFASRPAHLAYVIFTSGSTGRPKGVAVEHRQLLNYVAGFLDRVPVDPGCGWALVSTFAADLGHSMVYPALSTGGCLHVVSTGRVTDPAAFAEYFRRHRMDFLKIVPSHLAALMSAEEPRDLLPGRVLVLGGEAPSPALVERLRGLRPRCRILNHYGPTETTVGILAGDIQRTGAAARVPLGRPFRNCRIHLLDASLRPVMTGVAAEVHVGGAGLARGYLERPGGTAERFIPDPFASAGGERLYRTGDLARLTTGGHLEFLGRVDHQVKIHGYRIEPGEIEAALCRRPEIREALVSVHDGEGRKERRLVAYAVVRRGRRIDQDEVRGWLRESLPDYMVPSAVVALDSLPLTQNGKVDRQALPAPDQGLVRTPYEAPRNPVEEELADCWSEILAIEEIGINDNFFEMGGDSILAIQVVAAARRRGLRLTPQQLFEHQTIARLAPLAAAPGRGIEAEPGGRSGEAPLTPIQRWFFESRFEQPHHWNYSSLWEVNLALPAASVDRIVRLLIHHHDALRTRFESRGDDRRQVMDGADAAGGRAFGVVDFSALPDAPRDCAFRSAASRLQESLDLERGPLVRLVLFSQGATRPDRLLAIAHHLVVDSVSWRILIEDLGAAWKMSREGEPLALPARTTSWQRWSERWIEHAASSELAKEAEYWLAATRDAGGRLPCDHAGGEDTTSTAASEWIALDEAETRSLLREVPSAYRTQINDALLTALARTFESWTGEPLFVELEGHGREALFEGVDPTRTVGWFTTHYPIVFERVGHLDPGTALKAVKETLRTIPHRGAGYGLLRYASPDLAVRQRLGATPEPEIKFNYLGQFDGNDGAGAGTFAPLGEFRGHERSPRSERPRLLDVNGAVVGGCLRFRWTYSTSFHESATVGRLASRFVEELRELIDHCRSPEAWGVVPSDFPLADLDGETLAGLMAALAEQTGSSPREVEDVYPLSPLQESFLVHALAGRSGAGFEQKSSTIRGELDPETFRRAWQQVVECHPILRTGFFAEHPDGPLQIVFRRVRLPFDLQDWRDRSTKAQRKDLESLLASERERGFDLSRAPLMRLSLIRLGDDMHEIVWSYHHLIADAWARNQILQEVSTIYEALGRGERPALGACRPFRDYIEWLRRQDRESTAAFWRRELRDCRPMALELPVGRSDAAAGGQTLVLPASASAALHAMAQRSKLTLGTLLHGGWSLLLGRYSGRLDVVFGTTVSGRPAELEGVETIAGMFINNLPVRVKIAPRAPLGDWLAELQIRLARLRAHEWSSPRQIEDWAGVATGQRLFDSLVVFQNHPVETGPAEDASELQVLSLRSRFETGYPLSLVAGPLDPLTIRFFHDGRWADSDAIRRLAGHFGALLAGMVEAPDGSAGALSIFTPGERQELLGRWGRSAPGPKAEASLHRLFESRAARTPEAVALVSGGRRLAAAELNALADEMAHGLAGRGIDRGGRVGIYGVEPGWQAAAAALGVLKAGASFTFFTRHDPPERSIELVEANGNGIFLTRGSLPPAIGGGRPVIVDLDRFWTEKPPVERAPFRGPAAMPDALAWTLANGVAISHRAGLWLVRLIQDLGIDPEASVWLLDPHRVEPGVEELLTALALGMRAVVADSELRLCAFEEALEGRDSVLVSLGPPGPDDRILHRFETSYLGPRVEVLCFDPAPAQGRLNEILARGVFAVHVVWGTSEAGRGTIVQGFTREPDDRPAGGRVVAGARVCALDRDLEWVPSGMPGELHVGGRNLALGYWNRPASTAEKFVPDPHSGVPGERLYRTSEGARLPLAPGELEIMGPVARRAEADAEAALRSHPAVLQAAIRPWRDDAEESHLVAYVVADKVPSIQEVHEYLKSRLSRRRMPSLYVRMEALPHDQEGRVDQDALPAPDQVGDRVTSPYAGPCDSVELELRKIWEDLFGIRPIGVRDDFFELGGHSLLAVRMMAEVRRRFDRSLTLATLLQASTIEQLAELLRRRRKPVPWSPLVELRSGDGGPPLFCVHAMGGEVLSYVDLAHYLGPERPVYGLEARTWDHETPLHEEPRTPASLEEIAASYVEALRELQPEGPYHLLGWSFGGLLGFEMARQLTASGRRVGLLAILDTVVVARRRKKRDLAEILHTFAQAHPAVSPEVLRGLESPEEQLTYFVKMANEARFLPGLDLETAWRYARAGQVHSQARAAYRPRPYPGRITLMRAREGNVLTCSDKSLGWAGLAAGGLDVRDVPGNHHLILTRPHVQTLAKELRAVLAAGEKPSENPQTEEVIAC